MGSTTTSTALRSDSFPAGLRVLVVDHDPACLNILHKMLIKCKYEVSICNSAQEALDVLEKGGIDFVMSDVNVADMDGFKFLEQVGLKMDLPVIMMSVDGETSRVMKGVQHGACDYLLKPIRMKELRNIWQHVFRKKIHQAKAIQPKQDQPPLNNNSAIPISSTGNKRKDDDCKAAADPTSLKKPRVVWTIDLHHKFVKAVNCIGLDKVGPKKILDLMGVPWLTRENVASHLQKYRLYLSRLNKENDQNASCNGMKLSDFPSERPNAVTLQQNIVINESYGAHIHNHSTGSICEASILALPMQAEADKLMFGGDVVDDLSPSRMDYNQLMKSESKIQTHYTWSSGAPTPTPHPHLKPYFQPEHHHHLGSRREVDQSVEANINHYYSKNRSYAIGTDHAMLSITQQAHLTHSHALDDQNLHTNLESSFKNMIVGTAPPAVAALRLRSDVELNAYSSATASDHIYHLQNPHQLVSLQSFGCTNLVAADHARPELYDLHNFEDEYDANAAGCYDTSHQGLYHG